jgi:hypothetical protein
MELRPARLAAIESAQRASVRAGAINITPPNAAIRAICAYPRPIVGAFELTENAIIARGKRAATNDAMFVSSIAEEATRVTIACPETESVFGANHEATIRAAEAFVEYTAARASFVLDQFMCAIAAVDGVAIQALVDPESWPADRQLAALDDLLRG